MAGSPLIDVTALAGALGRPELAVVDCRFDLTDIDGGRLAYREAHIPGAVYAHLDHDLSAPEGPGRHPLPEVDIFARWLGAMGIGNESHVVAYDASGAAFASRLWWMLRSIGHQRVQVLDGGWQAWRDAGLPTERGWPEIDSTTYEAPATWTGVVDREQVRKSVGTATLIDARAAERFRGEFEPLDPVAGHIPTARNLPYSDNLTEDGTWRAPVELETRFRGLEGPLISYCGSGVTACHNILAMDLAGITNVALYPGSWSDWSHAGEEVATAP